MSKAMLECPRFHTCSVNNCPLHADYPNLPMLTGEARCGLGKARRLRIAMNHIDLQFGGLTSREYHAAERIANMTPKERENLRDRGVSLSKVLNTTGQSKSCAQAPLSEKS